MAFRLMPDSLSVLSDNLFPTLDRMLNNQG